MAEEIHYLTHILGKPIITQDGQVLGTVRDAIASQGGRLPTINALLVKGRTKEAWYSFSDIDITETGFTLRRPLDGITPYTPRTMDIRLQRDIMDKQIVDVHDYRVVRVNDVRIAEHQDRFVVIGADVSPRALFRRSGFGWLVEAVMNLFHRPLQSNLISWDDMEALQPDAERGGMIKLKVPHEKISRLHPADIADIVEQLSPQQRTEVIESLDIETAADTIQEMEKEEAASVMELMEEEKAADILEEMDPDDAADLLGDLSEARTEELLEHMEPEEAADIKELMSYGEETAGGLMTTEYLAIRETMSAQEGIDFLRSIAPKAEQIYYLYVVNDENHLVGVVSLRDLIVAQPTTPVEKFMVRNVRCVHTGEHADEVAHIFTRYNLLALPVVDDNGEMQGIITVDDMMERLLPAEKRRKLPQISLEEEENPHKDES